MSALQWHSCRPRGTHGVLLLAVLLVQSSWAGHSIMVVLDPSEATHQTVFSVLRKAITDGRESPVDLQLESRGLDETGDPSAERGPVDLIVTIGAKAAAQISRQETAAPVLNVLLPRAAYLQLNGEASHRPAAIFLDQPIERQFALARILLPNARRAGILRGARQPAAATPLAESAMRFGFDLNTISIDEDDDPAEAIQALLGYSDLIIATFDREAYRPATAKWLLYLAFQQRRPIVGFSYALLKAGAVAVVFSTPEQIAAHAADWVRDWLQSGNTPQGTAFPRYYRIGLNGPVAKTLGVETPPESDIERQVREALGEGR